MSMSISETQPTHMDVKGSTPKPPEITNADEAKEPENLVNPVEKSEEEAKPKLSREETEELVEALSDLAETIQTKLNFSINETTNDIVVKIIDKDTDTVIRQFPSEELLELQEKMIDLSGFLFDADV